MTGARLVLSYLLLLAATAAADVGVESTYAGHSNLLLITVDTLRADRLGSYGNKLGLTPHLDGLAARSQRFDSAYAPACVTLPSLAGLMTSRDPRELGVVSNLGRLDERRDTLAGSLRAQGWATAAVVSSAVLSERSGLSRGFVHFDAEIPVRRKGEPFAERRGAETTRAALAMLDRLLVAQESPFFLWVHYQDPHGPYDPPNGLRERMLPEARSKLGPRELRLSPNQLGLGALPRYQLREGRRTAAYYRAGYHGEIRHVDGEIGRLLRELDERRTARDTIVAFTADHGESLGERDYWFAHGEHLTDDQVRIPLLIFVPGRRAAVHTNPVSLLDVAPTLSAAVGATWSGEPGGRDLLAPVESHTDDAAYFSTAPPAATTSRSGIATSRYKLIRSDAPVSAGGNRLQLFLRGDETRDLADELPDLVRELEERLRQRDASFAEPRPVSERQLTPQDAEALRSLGYLE